MIHYLSCLSLLSDLLFLCSFLISEERHFTHLTSWKENYSFLGDISPAPGVPRNGQMPTERARHGEPALLWGTSFPTQIPHVPVRRTKGREGWGVGRGWGHAHFAEWVCIWPPWQIPVRMWTNPISRDLRVRGWWWDHWRRQTVHLNSAAAKRRWPPTPRDRWSAESLCVPETMN